MAQLSIKQVLTQSVELFNIQAQRDHRIIEEARQEVINNLNELDEKSTVLYGDIIDGYDSDTIANYATVTGAVDISTFTTATRLNLNNATRIGIGVAKAQAEKDHKAIQELINIQAENASVTDSEILALFDENVSRAYRMNHHDTYNYRTNPLDLLYDLKNSTASKDSFSTYTYAFVSDNSVIVNNGVNEVSFSLSGDDKTASSDNFSANYSSGIVTSN